MEHTAELKIMNDLAIALNILFDSTNSFKITFFFSHIE